MSNSIFTFLSLFSIFIGSTSLNAGLNKYTHWKVINGWLIERNINSADYSIRCRASKIDNYAWFGGRIHLDENDKIVIPNKSNTQTKIKSSDLQQIKAYLSLCRSDLINRGTIKQTRQSNIVYSIVPKFLLLKPINDLSSSD